MVGTWADSGRQNIDNAFVLRFAISWRLSGLNFQYFPSLDLPATLVLNHQTFQDFLVFSRFSFFLLFELENNFPIFVCESLMLC